MDSSTASSKQWNRAGILIYESEYKNGKLHGKCNKYDDLGNPLVLQIYDQGKLIEKKRLSKKDGP